MAAETILAAAAAVAISAWIQGSVGFGYALVSAPVLAMIEPGLVPGAVLLSSLFPSLASALRERASIDWRGVGIAIAGRLPGIAAGAALLAWIPEETMSYAVGATVLLGVALSVSGLHVAETARTLSIAGFVSGVTGTMTSIDGPPIALVYQHASGPKLRATLNTYFTIGGALSIVALVVAGRFGREQLLGAMAMLPAVAIGFAASGASRAWLDAGRTRAAVLGVASASALAVVLRELLR